jgi:molybdopterin-containing oxidoreductase family membrane subunit
MRNRICAIFDEPEEARRAVQGLLEAGVNPADVTVMSSEPHLEVDEFIPQARRTLIGYFSLAGGVLGAIAGFSLVYFTSRAYPIVTGAMPLVPPLTTGIVMYEMAALGAIFFALARMLWEARLPHWHAVRDDYAAELADGGVLISIKSASETGRWQEVLRNAGGREVLL